MAEKQKLESNEMLVQDLQSQVQLAVNALEIKEKTHYDDLLAKAKSTQSDNAFVDVIAFWDNLKRPDFAAYFRFHAPAALSAQQPDGLRAHLVDCSGWLWAR